VGDEPTRVEVDGVPTWWIQTPGPLSAGLIFRVGRVDERFATAGITHLVEHLAAFRIGQQPYRFNAFVDHHRTVFLVAGEADEVVGYIASICENLRDLPMERLETERRVLRTEGERHQVGTASQLWWQRFGVRGYGLLDQAEYGLRVVSPEDVAAWSADRFNRANAALWLSGQPPPGLHIDLPDGIRHPPPEPVPGPGVETPSHYRAGENHVAISMLAPRTTASAIAVSTIGRRSHARLRLDLGASYEVGSNWLPLTATTAFAFVSADGAKERGDEIASEMASSLERLVAEGPTEEELTEARDAWARQMQQPTLDATSADSSATDELVGRTHRSDEEVATEIASLSASDMAGAFHALAQTALLAIPSAVSAPPGRFSGRMPGPTFPEIHGRALTPYTPEIGARTEIGEEGVARVRDDGRGMAILWSECEAVLVEDWGRHEFVHLTGSTIKVTPWLLADGSFFIEEVRRHVPPHRIIPAGDDPGAWLDLWRLSDVQLGGPTGYSANLQSLAATLFRGERAETLATGVHEGKGGLLALTDQRLIHVSKERPADRRILFWRSERIDGVSGGAPKIGIGFGKISLHVGDAKVEIRDIKPRERAEAIVTSLRRPTRPDA
jgi:predicted Zn-dependent peptidase